jgi:uncharacterized membrane protein YdfJ with MMPL/SSD domain
LTSICSLSAETVSGIHTHTQTHTHTISAVTASGIGLATDVTLFNLQVHTILL